MSTFKFPLDVPSRRTQSLKCALTCLLALAAFVAMPLADSPMRSAQAQTSGENSLEAQEPTASINATQTNETIETNRNNDNFGQQNDHLAANPSTISSSGTSTTEVRPDQVSVTVGVETNGTTAQQAVSQNANLTAQVIAAVRGLGVTEDKIETSSFSVSPIYEPRQPLQQCIEIYPPPPGCETDQEIIGYRTTNTVTTTLDVPFLRMLAQATPDLNAGQVIDAAIGAGANRIDAVVFFVSQNRQQEVRDTLINEAIANARQRADIAAEALGTTVSGVESATLNPIDFPVFSVGLREGSAAGADSVSAPTPILPGQQEVSTTVNVVFYIVTGGSTDR
jgi:uncharacterized protein YggE